MVQIYNEITIYIYKQIFPLGASPLNPRLPPNPTDEVTPLYTPPRGGVYIFWGVKSSWVINMTENKDLKIIKLHNRKSPTWRLFSKTPPPFYMLYYDPSPWLLP
jgi:hypothetical protein